MGAGDCGSADDQSRPLRSFPLGGKTLTVWELGNFRRLARQPDNQSVSRTLDQPNQTNRLPILSAGQTLKHHTPSLSRSGISASLPPTSRLRRVNSRSANLCFELWIVLPPTYVKTSADKPVGYLRLPKEEYGRRKQKRNIIYPSSMSLQN